MSTRTSGSLNIVSQSDTFWTSNRLSLIFLERHIDDDDGDDEIDDVVGGSHDVSCRLSHLIYLLRCHCGLFGRIAECKAR
jgi:hypothetical protein